MSETLRLLFVLWGITGFLSLLFLVLGLLLYLRPPKMNRLYGYRTIKSMRDKTSWYMANKLAGKFLILIGCFSVMISIIGFLIQHFLVDDVSILGLFVPVIFQALIAISLVIPIIVIERKLTHYQNGEL